MSNIDFEKNNFFQELSNIIIDNDWDLQSPESTSTTCSTYHLADKVNQEKIKQKGRKLIKSSLFREQLIGYGLESYGYFYSSLESATKQKRKHPSEFQDYLKHLIYSDPDHFPKRIFNQFTKWLDKPKSIKIKHGDHYWKFITKYKN